MEGEVVVRPNNYSLPLPFLMIVIYNSECYANIVSENNLNHTSQILFHEKWHPFIRLGNQWENDNIQILKSTWVKLFGNK